MNKEKRRLHHKMIHKLMHKLGGRTSAAWYGEREKINHKVFTLIQHAKMNKFMKAQKRLQIAGIHQSIDKALI